MLRYLCNEKSNEWSLNLSHARSNKVVMVNGAASRTLDWTLSVSYEMNVMNRTDSKLRIQAQATGRGRGRYTNKI